jgi:hypothetical protein
VPPWPKFLPIHKTTFVEFFKLESIRGDGNCLFRALAAGVYNDQHQYKKLKEALLEYAQSRIRINDDDVNGIIRDRDIAVDLDIEDVPRFLHILTTDGEWGNQDHINCFMLRFNAPVFTWLEPKTEASADINADHPFEIARSKDHYAQALGPATDLWPLGPSKHQYIIEGLWKGVLNPFRKAFGKGFRRPFQRGFQRGLKGRHYIFMVLWNPFGRTFRKAFREGLQYRILKVAIKGVQ